MISFDAGNGSAWTYFTTHNTLHNGDSLSSWDFQMVEYAADTSVQSLTTNTTLFFALPVTFSSNTATIQGGFWAALETGEGGFGGDTHVGTSTVDFSNTLSWGGPGQLIVGGQTYGSSQFNVTGTSGLNYEVAFAPEPATAWGIGMALCGLGLVLRRRK